MAQPLGFTSFSLFPSVTFNVAHCAHDPNPQRVLDFCGADGMLSGAFMNQGIEGVLTMSQHPSLKSASKIKVRRNVLKRFERIDLLREQGKWKDGDRGTGLPKTKSEQ